jgi:short-subunit dehydrogenase
MTTNQGSGTALITGASKGIGAIYADRLARRGYDLILVARNGSALDRLAQQLRQETGRTVDVQAADLTHHADVARIEAILRENRDLTALVNNAGIGGPGLLLESDVNEMETMIDINVTALTRLIYAAVPGFVARGKGTLINIASATAIAPENLNGVYGATKAFVLALGHSLQSEIADKGVRVQTVLPASTATDFWAVAESKGRGAPAGTLMHPGAMVDAALVGLDNGELVTLPSLQDPEDWNRYEQLRREIRPRLVNAEPAPRYLVTVAK